LSAEREGHIRERRPDLLPVFRDRLIQTLYDPDEVRSSARLGKARVFSRWFDNIKGGKYVVVVVVSEHAGRQGVVTAYLTRSLAKGVVEWKRS
jgi:hypothetical protein